MKSTVIHVKILNYACIVVVQAGQLEHQQHVQLAQQQAFVNIAKIVQVNARYVEERANLHVLLVTAQENLFHQWELIIAQYV